MQQSSPKSGPILSVRDLSVAFPQDGRSIEVVEHVSFDLAPGGALAIVGESGCGKTVTGLSLIGLTSPGKVTSGSIRLEDEELIGIPERRWEQIRGTRIAMVFQDPLTSLDPVYPIDEQVAEGLRYHQRLSRRSARVEAVRLLHEVGIPEKTINARPFPHQLSGGMRQRVMIAAAIACRPQVLIADEPTTALDVTVQAQILDLLRALQTEYTMSMIIITHDLGVVARSADRVAVMYAGQIVEQGATRQVLDAPLHPYTAGLIGAVPRATQGAGRLVSIPGVVPHPGAFPTGCRFQPRCRRSGPGCEGPQDLADQGADRLVRCLYPLQAPDPATRREATRKGAPMSDRTPVGDPLIHANHLVKVFPSRDSSGEMLAVDDVSFEIRPGETLGLVGESGSGKSTTGRLVLRLIEPTSGEVIFAGARLSDLRGLSLMAFRRQAQIIFQDPYSSLDPRMTVSRIISEPLKIHGLIQGDGRDQVNGLLEMVGLRPDHADRYPFQFSGGQRQRISIARALSLLPRILVADEPVSSLDVSVQAQIVNLLQDLQSELGLALLFISHDLAVVRHLCHSTAVMRRGRIVEYGPTERIFTDPQHEYTRLLLGSILL